MTTPFSGLPARVQANLPTAKAIVSTTLATPIVVTTAAPHGLRPGDYFAVYGATDLAANGLWMAGTVGSTTTVVLLVPSTGANSVGVTGGAAVGSLAPAGYGVTAPILSDADPPSAALWNVPYEAGFDRLAWLLFTTNYLLTIKAGGSLFMKALSTFVAEPTSAFDGVFDFLATSSVFLRGRRGIGARVPITDGVGVTIDVTQGARRTIVGTPGAARTIILDSTTHVPEDDEIIEVTWYVNAQPSSTVLTFQRDAGAGSTPIASMTPSDVLDDMLFHVRFEYSGGAWHLGPCTPNMNDGTADYGVKALSGA